MKKVIVALLVFVCAGAALSAQVSIGVGGNFTADFTTLVLSKDAKDAGLDVNNEHLMGGGFYIFFDAVYVEANVGMLFGNCNADKTDGMTDDQKKGMDVTALKLGLFGKYPIDLGGFTLFPMLGIDGQLTLGGKIMGEEIPSAFEDDFKKMFNNFWIKLGVGADIPLGDALYLRPEFLYGIRLNTDTEKDLIDAYNAGSVKILDAIVGHGMDIRVALGFKF